MLCCFESEILLFRRMGCGRGNDRICVLFVVGDNKCVD
ncbi:hypothetical protein Golob_019095 [Gossypium lobatum]|uniref:Uncharacterized protein n=1 Tax=Gossypium lobatum TaxID=34289 RepID=A0A7J8L688_9ROSI|nr:hypothetical protein [Gossypium lobatum]